MVDAVGGVAKIVGVALKIKEAANTVHQNKKDCHHIKSRVDILNKTFSHHENNTELAEDSAVMAALEALDGILAEALEVITKCQKERCIICVYYTAGNLSRRLSKVEQRISYLSSDAMLTIMSYQLLRKSQEGAPHPPPQISEQNHDEANKEDMTQTSQRPRIPAFGDWENSEDVPYTQKFEGARKSKKTGVYANPNEPERQPEPPRKSPLNPAAYTADSRERAPRTTLHGRRAANDPHHREFAPRRQTNPQQEQWGDASAPRRPYRNVAGSASPMQSNSPSRPKYRAAGMQTSERRSDAHGQRTPAAPRRGRMRSKQGYNPEEDVAVPPFGEWDAGERASGEKYTVMFSSVRDKLSQSSGNHRQENKVELALPPPPSPPPSPHPPPPSPHPPPPMCRLSKMDGKPRSLVHITAEVTCNIRVAMETVLENRDECLQIGELVKKVSILLTQLDGTKMVDEPAMRGALEKLLATFRHAHTLVVACQRRGFAIVWLSSPPSRLSTQLHEVMDQIASSIADMTAIVLT